MSHLTILRSYALKSDPSSLPLSVLFSHTDTSLTVFDAYPKSIFHFLVLPRPKTSEGLTVFDLASLATLLKGDKERAKRVLESLAADAAEVRKEIEQKMLERYGFVWDIWTGFHAVQSMEHLHLHIISSDLCSPALKNKKHYNSFHPKLGFFLHLTDVLSWFESESSYFDTMAKLKKSQYQPMLKEDLMCWRCDRMIKNVPLLKAHLQDDWDKLAKSQKTKIARKKIKEMEGDTHDTQNLEKPSKKRRTDNMDSTDSTL